MKCPKCGYTSFDYLNECKKCGTDISDVRAMLGIIAIAPEDRALAKPAASTAQAEPDHDELDFSTAGLLADVDTPIEKESSLGGDFITDFESEGDSDEDTADSALVEHTSYSAPAAKPAASVPTPVKPSGFDFSENDDGTLAITGAGEEDDDESAPSDDFLDMDFSDVFDEGKKK
ncbi:hypothetical protein FDZ71_12165 [bacterium]|nr:MAG: hypothetical protein FDZ71_12165 [bacterium]